MNIEKLEYYKRLVIPSTPEGLKTCLNLIPDIEYKLHFDDKTSFALRTVLIESVTNAICHGNHYRKELQAIITIKIDAKRIIVEVEDQGEGFDASLIPSPLDQDNISMESGRGIFFIRAFCDSFNTIGKGNIVNIIINR
jgi:anti-sigma regulatory factor (Ser/Thr protein kinase)